MFRDILTVYFIVAGCFLLWLNFRPQKIVLAKDDDADVAHPHPEHLVPDPHLVAEGAESLIRAEDGDARSEGGLALEADLQRIALKEMARNARTGSTPDDRRRAFGALIGTARSPGARSRAKGDDADADDDQPDLAVVADQAARPRHALMIDAMVAQRQPEAEPRQADRR
jgi:hypothetical protein